MKREIKDGDRVRIAPSQVLTSEAKLLGRSVLRVIYVWEAGVALLVREKEAHGHLGHDTRRFLYRLEWLEYVKPPCKGCEASGLLEASAHCHACYDNGREDEP